MPACPFAFRNRNVNMLLHPSGMVLKSQIRNGLKICINYYQKETFNNQHGQNHNHWFWQLFPKILTVDSK